MKKSIESTVAIVVGVVAIVVIWSVAAFALNDEMMMPAPSAVAKEFIAVFGEKSTYKSIIGTLWRSTISFSVAFAFAVLFALAANVSSFCEKLFLSAHRARARRAGDEYYFHLPCVGEGG